MLRIDISTTAAATNARNNIARNATALAPDYPLRVPANSNGNANKAGVSSDSTTNTTIHRGRTGNPVGSLGYLIDITATTTEEETMLVHWDDRDGSDVEGGGDGGVVHAADGVRLSEDDNTSNTTGNNESTNHFPLEISTDSGGVSALLPSGQVLVDRIGAADKLLNKMLGGTKNEHSRKENDHDVEEARSSDTADYATSPKESPREESQSPSPKEEDDDEEDKVTLPLFTPLKTTSSGGAAMVLSPDTPGFTAFMECEREKVTLPLFTPLKSTSDVAGGMVLSPDTPGFTAFMEYINNGQHHQHQPRSSTDEQQQQQQPLQSTKESSSSPQDGAPGDEESSPLYQTRTQNSSSSDISEDPTFNSYAASELSSMMSHLEIQKLLKQGRQQQQDIMMFHNGNSNMYANNNVGNGNNSIHSGPPTVIGGGREGLRSNANAHTNSGNHGGKKQHNKPTMVLYSNDAVREFPQVVQSTPSLTSSHCLQRTDAMEDASVSKNVHLGARMPLAAPPQQEARQQVQQQQHYPHLLYVPSMTSTITTVQSHAPNTAMNNTNMPTRIMHNHASNDNHPDSSSSSSRLMYAKPLRRLSSSASTAPSVVTESSCTADGHGGVTVEVEVVRSPTPSFTVDYDVVDEQQQEQKNVVQQEVQAAVDLINETASGIQAGRHGLEGGGGYYRSTSNSTEKKSVQSLLGTSTKSLADDLMFHDDDDEDDEGSDISECSNDDNGNAAKIHEGRHHAPIMPQAVSLSHNVSLGGDDGYSADRSSYTSLRSSNNIEEYSTSTGNNSFGLELLHAQGLPSMTGESEDTEDSRYLPSGYHGHTYHLEQLPPQAYSKPVFPSTFPSLMDSSVSSALTTASTVLSSVAQPLSVGLHNNSGKRHDNMETEEREDSLPHVVMNRMNPSSGIHDVARRDEISNAAIASQGNNGHTDPLMATASTTMTSSMPSLHDGNAMEVPINDPRLNVDYERRYVVDLEMINEENSSGTHTMLSNVASSVSSPTRAAAKENAAAAAAAVSLNNDVFVAPPAPATRTTASVDFRTGTNNTDTIPEATGNHQQQEQLLNHYRHQYYTEQYHYCDDRFSQASQRNNTGNSNSISTNNDCDDEDNSTCSSVTLSQAFNHSHDGTDSCSSSITEEYSQQYSESQMSSHPSHPSLPSTVSSVTLSQALSFERHEHDMQGFYVATRLGNFVEVPTGNDGSLENGDGHDEPQFLTEEAAARAVNNSAFKTVYEEGEVSLFDGDKRTVGDEATADTDTKSDTVKSTGTRSDNTTSEDSSGSFKSATTDDDAVSDMAMAAAESSKNSNNKQPKNTTQTIAASTAEDIGSDILSALVPECGVPIPSVMAKVGSTSNRRRKASRGGMLLPWHSTRSIQNYQHSRRGSKSKGGLYSSSSRSREGGSPSIFSIASVHTFRG